MRRSASEIINDLERRIARLEAKKAKIHDDHSIADLRKKVVNSSLTRKQKEELLKAFDKSALNYKAMNLRKAAGEIKYDQSVVDVALKGLGESEIAQMINFFG